MGPDLRINWDDVCSNPDDFEKLVKLLLQRLYLDGQALDGAGGDGGRDFQAQTAHGLEFFDAKSFTGRLSRRNPARRSQVEKSLTSAARSQPNAWHLVVPIDHNPSELKWFDDLRAGVYPFVGKWLGRTWLETQIAMHPDLHRYAIENKLLEYVQTYNLETQALIGGTPLLDRLQALNQLTNEISPYWRPIFGRLPDGNVYTSIEAKRDDAAEQAPITFTLGTTFPDTPEHAQLRDEFRTSLELGTGVILPREYITEFSAEGPPGLGLPDGRIPDFIELIAIPDTGVDHLPSQKLAVLEPGREQPTASLTFYAEHRVEGTAGTRVTSYDTAHTIKLTTDVRSDSMQLNLQAQDRRPITPGELLPAIRFVRAAIPPNRLRLIIGDNSYTGDHTLREPFLPGPPDDVLAQFVEDLAAVQDATNNTFAIPDTFTGRDAHQAQRLRRLLGGERVKWLRGPLTVSIFPDRVAEFRAQFVDAPRGWLRISSDGTEITLGDHIVHTGPLWMLGEMSVDVDTIGQGASDGTPSAVFEVLGDGWMYAQRGTPDGLSIG